MRASVAGITRLVICLTSESNIAVVGPRSAIIYITVKITLAEELPLSAAVDIAKMDAFEILFTYDSVRALEEKRAMITTG